MGSADHAPAGAGLKTSEAQTEFNQSGLVAQLREKIKNYLQFDDVFFLFGTGPSIHLGITCIQNNPSQVEKGIEASGSNGRKKDFKNYVCFTTTDESRSQSGKGQLIPRQP